MATGTQILDFTSTPLDEVSATVTTSGLTASSHIEAWVQRDITADNGEDEHEMLAVFGRFSCKFLTSTTFDLKCNLIGLLAVGQFTVHWATV